MKPTAKYQTTLKYLRGKTGLTQRQVETMLGIPHPTYSMLENGRMISPQPFTAKKLENFWRLPIDRLLQPYSSNGNGAELPTPESVWRKLKQAEKDIQETINIARTLPGWDVKKLRELLRMIRRKTSAIEDEMLGPQT